jgi:hypothetical protein
VGIVESSFSRSVITPKAPPTPIINYGGSAVSLGASLNLSTDDLKIEDSLFFYMSLIKCSASSIYFLISYFFMMLKIYWLC